MRVVIQRVKSARVISLHDAAEQQIGKGLLVFLGCEKDDTECIAQSYCKKIAHMRIFPDTGGKMNCSAVDIDSDMMVIPNFTLAADTATGTRPSFSTAMKSQGAQELYDFFCHAMTSYFGVVKKGFFGQEMEVELTNSGPVTFLL